VEDGRLVFNNEEDFKEVYDNYLTDKQINAGLRLDRVISDFESYEEFFERAILDNMFMEDADPAEIPKYDWRVNMMKVKIDKNIEYLITPQIPSKESRIFCNKYGIYQIGDKIYRVLQDKVVTGTTDDIQSFENITTIAEVEKYSYKITLIEEPFVEKGYEWDDCGVDVYHNTSPKYRMDYGYGVYKLFIGYSAYYTQLFSKVVSSRKLWWQIAWHPVTTNLRLKVENTIYRVDNTKNFMNRPWEELTHSEYKASWAQLSGDRDMEWIFGAHVFSLLDAKDPDIDNANWIERALSFSN